MDPAGELAGPRTRVIPTQAATAVQPPAERFIMADIDDDNPDATGIGFTPKTYELAPEDAELGASIRDFSMNDVPGPVSGGEGIKVPTQLTASILPPEKQAEVEAALSGLTLTARQQREPQLVQQALEDNHFELMVAMGPGEGATAYQREYFQQLNEGRDIQQQLAAIEADLAEVVDKRRDEDPTTGATVWHDVHKLEGQQRTNAEHRRTDLLYRLSLLKGVEGQRRLEKATVDAVEQHKARQAALADEAEAQKRADEMLREERIEERATLYAKSKRGMR